MKICPIFKNDDPAICSNYRISDPYERAVWVSEINHKSTISAISNLVNPLPTIYSHYFQLYVAAVFSAIEIESAVMGLPITEGKTKYTLSKSKDTRYTGFQITGGNYIFNVVKEFLYLGSIASSNNSSL